MGLIRVFIHVTIDGFFSGPDGEMDWFMAVHDEEWKRCAGEMAGSAPSTLMFGRTTYDIMKNFWSTPVALQLDPAMTEIMRSSAKIVYSTTLGPEPDEPGWKNTTVYPKIDARTLEDLKKAGDIMILGSGTIVRQLTDLGLIDEYLLVVIPVILGSGKPLFLDVHRKTMELQDARHFASGIVLLTYRPLR